MGIQPNSLTNSPNLPFLWTPRETLSDRRLDVLRDFNRKVAENSRPPQGVFFDFMEFFTYMGPIDLLGDFIDDDRRKSETLSRLARCHIATSSAGRDFLAGQGLLSQVVDDSWTLMRGLRRAAREQMLEGAELGDRHLIVMTFPNLELRMPLEIECFRRGDGALSEAEAWKLIMTCDATNRTLLDRFASEQRSAQVETYDTDVLRAWCELLNCCRRQTPVGQHGSKEILEAFGYAYLAIARGAATKEDHARLPLLEILRLCVQFFDEAISPKASGLVWRDVAKYFHEKGEKSQEIVALNTAGAKLFLAADGYSLLKQADKARKFLEMAFDAYRESGNLAETSRTGKALFDCHIDCNFQSRARAVAAIVADAERRLGNIEVADRWKALAKQVPPLEGQKPPIDAVDVVSRGPVAVGYPTARTAILESA
ncbi:hypothetical protein [Pandoraea commovens]|uniref:Uncharacterized protein n=1 Tax=Pandoraea commovens TaxID=2508289 RepID=A0A5E4X5I9_9BURK|nr:hypothetical protein [Pandoraea commovens]VVE31604.1 hypothetical protein PCO31010_03705 [Pandoraea commovens]